MIMDLSQPIDRVDLRYHTELRVIIHIEKQPWNRSIEQLVYGCKDINMRLVPRALSNVIYIKLDHKQSGMFSLTSISYLSDRISRLVVMQIRDYGDNKINHSTSNMPKFLNSVSFFNFSTFTFKHDYYPVSRMIEYGDHLEIPYVWRRSEKEMIQGFREIGV